MADNQDKGMRLYYSIAEVAEMFGVNESALRYWEKEFSFLKPKTKGSSMVRQYTEKDIEHIRLIHNLVRVRGFKIAAAKKIINSNRTGADRTAVAIERLYGIRSELTAMKHQLDMLA